MTLDKSFQLQILMPSGIYYQDQIMELVFPAKDGLRAILYNHAPFLSAIGKGVLRINKPDGTSKQFEIQQGMLHIKQNLCTILTEHIGLSQDIVSQT